MGQLPISSIQALLTPQTGFGGCSQFQGLPPECGPPPVLVRGPKWAETDHFCAVEGAG